MRLVVFAAAAAAFVACAAVVVAGAFGSLDQYAVEHWMTGLDPTQTASLSLSSLLWPHLGSPLHTFCNFWTYPAGVLQSALLLGICCVVLVRRGQPSAAAALAAAWLIGNGVEVLGKLTLVRPDLHVGNVPVTPFHHSFPSGHAFRALFLAAAIAYVWPHLALPAFAWAAVVLPALVVRAAHTPSDVLGGVLLATAAVLAVHAFLRPRSAVQPASRIGALALEDR